MKSLSRNFCALLLIFIFSLPTLSARDKQKEKFFIGPHAGINVLTGESSKYFDPGYSLGIDAIYFIKENVGVNFGLLYNPFPTYSEGEGESEYKMSMMDISLIVGINYFFGELKKDITPFIGISSGYLLYSSKTESEDYNSDYTSQFSMIAPQAGVTYPLSKNLVLEAKFKYLISWVHFEYEDYWTGFEHSYSALTDYNYMSFNLSAYFNF